MLPQAAHSASRRCRLPAHDLSSHPRVRGLCPGDTPGSSASPGGLLATHCVTALGKRRRVASASWALVRIQMRMACAATGRRHARGGVEAARGGCDVRCTCNQGHIGLWAWSAAPCTPLAACGLSPFVAGGATHGPAACARQPLAQQAR